MSNKEIIQENNTKLQECVGLANGLPEYQDITYQYANSDAISSENIPITSRPLGNTRVNLVSNYNGEYILIAGESRAELFKLEEGEYISKLYITNIRSSTSLLGPVDGYIYFNNQYGSNWYKVNINTWESTTTKFSNVSNYALMTYDPMSNMAIGQGSGSTMYYINFNTMLSGSIKLLNISEYFLNRSGNIIWSPIPYSEKSLLAKMSGVSLLNQYWVTNDEKIQAISELRDYAIIGGNFCSLNAALEPTIIKSANVENKVSWMLPDNKTLFVFPNWGNNNTELIVYNIDWENLECNYVKTLNLGLSNERGYNFWGANGTQIYFTDKGVLSGLGNVDNGFLNYDAKEQTDSIVRITLNGTTYTVSEPSFSAEYVLQSHRFLLEDGTLANGTMPNNGELNYNSSTSTQTIPAGYTSGGTITPAPLTDTEYDECLELSEQILGENVSL